MRLERYLKGMEYLHATLFFAMFVPLVYAGTKWADPAGTGALYLKCLLIIIPVIVTKQAAKRVRGVILYFLICVLLLAGMGMLTGAIAYLSGERGRFENYEICYCVGMMLETLFIAIKRFVDRVRAVKWEREEPLAAKQISFLDVPARFLVWYFVVLYLVGICINAKLLCDIAFYSAIIYIFLVLFYDFFGQTKAYLKMNKRTKGIPKRRLYGVSFSMLLVFALLLFAGMIPAVFLAGQRQYTDVREWFGDVELAPYDYESDAGFEAPASGGGADWMELLADGEPAPEPSKFFNAIFWVIGIVCILIFLYGVFQIIRQILQDFRNSRDENGDIVEEIADDQGVKQREHALDWKGRRGVESEAERIRRMYRKTIRKHRKERPAPYESPTEIEEYAGLKNDEQMQQLHRKYEEVRYGKL